MVTKLFFYFMQAYRKDTEFIPKTQRKYVIEKISDLNDKRRKIVLVNSHRYEYMLELVQNIRSNHVNSFFLIVQTFPKNSSLLVQIKFRIMQTR